MTHSNREPEAVICGKLQRDFRLPASGAALIDVPGGSLLHAAAGWEVWNEPAAAKNTSKKASPKIHPSRLGLAPKHLGLAPKRLGLVARVGRDFPAEWLDRLREYGWDTNGIQRLESDLDLRSFQATLPDRTVQVSNPVAHFTRLQLPFPKSLLGYQSAVADESPGLPQAWSPRPAGIPPDYLAAHAVHLCPMDIPSGCRLSSLFREASVTTITIDPGSPALKDASLEQLRILLHGVSAFLPSEEEVRRLFWGQTDDLWQMTDALAAFGVEFIVIKRGALGQRLYDSAAKKRWEVPAYPVDLVDATGAGDSFCGGFLAGYQRTYDPVQGVLQGSISASLTIQGSRTFHALEALPGLALRRMEALTKLVRKV